MKEIIIILGLTILTLLSCSGNKTETKNAEVATLENKTKTKSIKIATGCKIVESDKISDPIKYTKELDLYLIRDLEENASKNVGFISLSDIYPLSENRDSLAIPNLENLDKNDLQYFKLNSSYRKRFLSKTNIAVTDSVYIYDYSTDVLLSFSVQKLNVVAYLNDYKNVKDCPCNQFDYMIGFEITKKNLKGLSKYFSTALVFIGEENPFMQGKMKPIVWKKIKTEKFPSEKSNLTKLEIQYKAKNTVKGQAYSYENDLYQVFIQDYIDPKGEYIYATRDRHLIVINKQFKKVENEMLLSAGESASLAALNFGVDGNGYDKVQWTGQLFKNKPDVFFGFKWYSFGCPTINFLNSKDKYVQINCDNRH